jgi:TPR repeat protein
MKENVNIKIATELNQLMHKYYKEIQYNQIIKLIKVQMELLEIAAKENNKDAQDELALLYGESAFFNKNPFFNKNKYVYWLKKAVKNGHVEAKINLASVYMTDENEKYSNVLKGLSLIKEAYNEGNEVAKINYEICIKNLRKKNSSLVKEIKKYFKKHPNKAKLFLEKNPDYATVLKL